MSKVIEEAKVWLDLGIDNLYLDTDCDDIYKSEDVIESLITELESKNKEVEQHKAITEAAKFLVKVKSRKGTQVAWYLASWPSAWRKIEEALAQLLEEGE